MEIVFSINNNAEIMVMPGDRFKFCVNQKN